MTANLSRVFISAQHPEVRIVPDDVRTSALSLPESVGGFELAFVKNLLLFEKGFVRDRFGKWRQPFQLNLTADSLYWPMSQPFLAFEPTFFWHSRQPFIMAFFKQPLWPLSQPFISAFEPMAFEPTLMAFLSQPFRPLCQTFRFAVRSFAKFSTCSFCGLFSLVFRNFPLRDVTPDVRTVPT